ncbi:MAG: outer membrane protein assembly factor BamA [Candidatus Aminicenantes bacterium]|nr:MAG: outer membrane protein assembly factor BamA [Candidatus Aminicenantes bacterium]
MRSNKHAIFGIFLLVVSLFLFSMVSFSKSNGSSARVIKISIVVDGQSGGKDMQELIPIKEGELFSLKKISNSIKQIYQTGLFSSIEVLREGNEAIQLTFLLMRKPLTQKIFFQGKAEISRKKMREGLYSLRVGSSFSEARLKKAVEELKETLSREGYFQSEIKASVDKDPKTSSIDVTFEILSAKRFLIDKIAVSGELLLPEAELRKKIESKEGKPYIPSVLDEDITRLREIYNSMDYQRTEIELEERNFNEEKERVSLSLKVTPHEKVEIVVRGAKVPLSLLRPIWEARIFEEWGLTEGEAKILAYLRKKGYLFSSANSYVEKADNEIRVIYEVSQGEKYKIRDISFEGVGYFTPSQLKKELRIGEKILFLGWVDGARLFELPREIELLYKTHGFPDARVDLAFRREAGKVDALFNIEEGGQEKIETISFEGISLFSQATLLEQISSFQKGPFFQPNIQKDLEKLERFYLNQGIRGTEVRAQVEIIGEALFSVVFQISEGKKVEIEKIVITGNKVTKRSTILRELRIKERDYAFYEKIRESKRRLERLGIFTEVKIEEIPLSPERENLVLSVREGARNYAGLGIGLETRNEPQNLAIWNNVIRPRGTAEFIRGNILGRAAQLSLVGQISLKERRSVFSWEQPYFFGLPMQTYLNAWIEREQRTSYSFDRQGFSLTAIKTFSKEFMLLTTLRWVRTTLFGLEIEPNELDRQHQPFSATSISGSFIWDRRDDPFNPEKGYFLSFALERAYPLFMSESDFFKSFVKYQHFIPVISGITFSLTSRLGVGEGDIPIHERFFAGGSNSFRGAEFDELGPRDYTSFKPIGGKALFLLNLELTFPLLSALKDFSGVLFYDKGSVFEETMDYNLAGLEDALGIGIRYRTPLGPVRLELGWNFDAPKEKRKVLAFISIGNVF